jgi:chromosome segregation ATPase
MSGWGLLNAVTKAAASKWTDLEQSLDQAVGNTPVKSLPEATSEATPEGKKKYNNNKVKLSTGNKDTTSTNDGWSAWSPSVSNSSAAKPSLTSTPISTPTLTSMSSDNHTSTPPPSSVTQLNNQNNLDKNNVSADTVALKAKLRQCVKKLRASRATQKQSMELIQTLEQKLEEQGINMKQQIFQTEQENDRLRKELTDLHQNQEEKERRKEQQQQEEEEEAEEEEHETWEEMGKVPESSVKVPLSTLIDTDEQQQQQSEQDKQDKQDKQQFEELKRERDLLQDKKISAQKQIKELQTNLSRRAQQLETLHVQFAALHETETEQSSQIDTLQNDNDQLSTHIIGLNDQISIISSSLEETKGLNVNLSKSNASLQMQLTKQMKKNDAIMEEGVQWSKDAAKQQKIIRRLREQIDEYENEEEETEAKTEAIESNLKSLRERLDVEREQVQQLKKSLKESNSTTSKEKKITQSLRAELQKAKFNIGDLETLLQTTKKMCDDRGEQLAAMREEAKRGEGHEKRAVESSSRVIVLEEELETSREVLRQARRESSETEERLEREIKSMHMKWQAAEKRSEQMTEQVTSSTRPLLRQIAALQQLLEEQRESWSMSETTLTQRAVRAETERARADERSKATASDLHAEKLKTIRFDEITKRHRQTMEAAEESAVVVEKKLQEMARALKEESKQRVALLIQLKTLQHEHALMASSHKKVVESYKEERGRSTKVEEQRRKVDDASKEEHGRILHALKEKEQEIKSLRRSVVENGGTVNVAKQPWIHKAEVHNNNGRNSGSGSGSGSGRGVGIRNSGMSDGDGSITKMNGARHIQAQNKFLETRCLEAEKSRNTMATKLVAMGSQLTKMQGIEASTAVIKQKYATLEQKQEVLLELLGEKTEEADNLMVDIQEMKRMYRQQTESMLEQLAAATS